MRLSRWICLVFAAAACGDGLPARLPFRVRQVVPGSTDSAATLFLNQEVVVYLSDAVDPMSVKGEAVRILDERGQPVKGTLRTGTHSVIFAPDPPLRAALDDGTFLPSARYRLEVAGFPRANALRALDGRVLEKTVVRDLLTVAADGGDGVAGPFLPEGTQHPFVLRREFLKMAADSASLQLSFSRPLLPHTVTGEAFEVYRVRAGQPNEERLALRSARAVSLPRDPFPGCTVDLALAGRPVRLGDHLFVRLTSGENALREYGGATVADLGSALSVPVVEGERLPLLETEFEDGGVLTPIGEGVLGFETRQGRTMPRVRSEAGDGRLGVFAPRRSLTLYPGQPFDRGDGVVVHPEGGVFDFLDIRIPVGVEVRLRGGEEHRVQVRACGSVAVAGRLVLDGTFLGQAQQQLAHIGTPELLDDAHVALVAGGDLEISGSIVHEASGNDHDRGASPITLLCGGRLTLGVTASLPAGTVCATAGGGQRQESASLHTVPVVAWMRPAPPEGVELDAVAWTPWQLIPESQSGAIEPVLVGAKGDLRVAVQVADPDPLAARPLDDPQVLRPPEPLPLDRTLFAPAGSYVRFELRARVRAGVALPSLERICVYAAR